MFPFLLKRRIVRWVTLYWSQREGSQLFLMQYASSLVFSRIYIFCGSLFLQKKKKLFCLWFKNGFFFCKYNLLLDRGRQKSYDKKLTFESSNNSSIECCCSNSFLNQLSFVYTKLKARNYI